jgi:hypothetical protein
VKIDMCKAGAKDGAVLVQRLKSHHNCSETALEYSYVKISSARAA